MTNQILSPELSDRVRSLSDEVLVLALDAVREGRNVATQELGALCQLLLAELEQQYDELGPDEVERFIQQYEHASPAPVVAAYFGGAAQMVERLKQELSERGWREHG